MLNLSKTFKSLPLTTRNEFKYYAELMGIGLLALLIGGVFVLTIYLNQLGWETALETCSKTHSIETCLHELN